VVILVGQHQSSLCYLWVLSVAWQRLARPPIPFGLSAGLEPTGRKWNPPDCAMHLLCALAPSQNVVGLVDCGLHLAASYASLMPTQNPIDPWSKASVENEKSRYYCTGSNPPRIPGGQCMSNGFRSIAFDSNRDHYTRIPALRKNFEKYCCWPALISG